ncbi:MAG: HAD-IIB family hydrolase [Clostridia bacterium]|nr:HAD-IIB family hydrolase [Clostridia bacterium]
MKYMLAVDYDNTLFQNDEISKETIEAINEFRSLGNLFGIVSGRDYVTGFETFKAENLFPFDFLLLKTGAMACDANGDVLYETTINGKMLWGESTLVPKLAKSAFECGANFCTVSVGKTRRYFYKNYPDGLDREFRTPHPHSELLDVEEVGQISVLCKTDEKATEVAKKLKTEFGSVLNPLQNTIAIDISPAGIDKATGIEKYAKYMGIPYENIWVAGDNYNDLAMLKSYHSCAMTCGVDAAKEAAEYVCDTVGDVIKIIKEKA